MRVSSLRVQVRASLITSSSGSSAQEGVTHLERAVDVDNERLVVVGTPERAVNDKFSVDMRFFTGTPVIKAVDFRLVSKSASIVRCNFFLERTNDGTDSSFGISYHFGPWKLSRYCAGC